MDLSLSDEQKQLQDAAERFVRDKYAFENRRKIVATEKGWLPENWAANSLTEVKAWSSWPSAVIRSRNSIRFRLASMTTFFRA